MSNFRQAHNLSFRNKETGQYTSEWSVACYASLTYHRDKKALTDIAVHFPSDGPVCWEHLNRMYEHPMFKDMFDGPYKRNSVRRGYITCKLNPDVDANLFVFGLQVLRTPWEFDRHKVLSKIYETTDATFAEAMLMAASLSDELGWKNVSNSNHCAWHLLSVYRSNNYRNFVERGVTWHGKKFSELGGRSGSPNDFVGSLQSGDSSFSKLFDSYRAKNKRSSRAVYQTGFFGQIYKLEANEDNRGDFLQSFVDFLRKEGSNGEPYDFH